MLRVHGEFEDENASATPSASSAHDGPRPSPGPHEEFPVILHGRVQKWSRRHSHCVAWQNSTLLLIGGFASPDGSLNDVWRSRDGQVCGQA